MTTRQHTQADHVRSAIKCLTELSCPQGNGWGLAQRTSSREHKLGVLRHVAGHIAQARRKLAKELMDDRASLQLRAEIRRDLSP